MSKISYYTEKGLKNLRKKLDHLKDVERPRASQAIAEARDKGDLSENAEYDAAKEAQGLLELEISKLEETLSNARIIDESKLDTSKVLVLSTVKIKNLNNSATMEYKLVAQSEADLAKGKISVDSPIGKGLLGKKVGDTAEISIPNGNVKFEILENFKIMASIFTKIILGEIPSYKIYEDENYYAFLDINPNALGHTLCIPKKEVDKLFDLDDETYKGLMIFSKKIAEALKKAVDCQRIGISVIGLEVPHVHVHLIPINKMEDMSFNSKIKLSDDEFVDIMEKIKSYL